MGWLRVLLALSVLLEHSGGIGGYTLIGGPLAVQCFFIISGFYMGLVLNERYDRPSLNRAFYLNRMLRIHGIYLVFLALHLAFFALVHWRTGGSPLSPYFDSPLPWHQKAGLALLNLTVIGQDLPLFLTVRDGHLAWTSHFAGSGAGEVFHFMAIPAAWSLSLELCFYAVAPFIVRRPAWQIAVLAGLSLLARAIAAANGLIADPFNYRFFPFELALFLTGTLAYKAWAAQKTVWAQPRLRLLALAVPLALASYRWWPGGWPVDAFLVPARLALLMLVAAGLPAIHAWRGRSAADRAVGELSYPLYLGHLLVLGLIAGIPALKASPNLLSLATVGAGLVLAWAAVRLVDSRIEALRRTLAARAGASA